jgi:hypothetical protein
MKKSESNSLAKHFDICLVIFIIDTYNPREKRRLSNKKPLI